MRGGSESDGGDGPAGVQGTLRSTAELIIASRLLTLQSRRILLATTARKLFFLGDEEELEKQVKSLEERTANAEREYKKAVLKWAQPETAQLWLVSYQQMIEEAENLAMHLRSSAAQLSGMDRAEISADVVRLDKVIERWREAMKPRIAAGGGRKSRAG